MCNLSWITSYQVNNNNNVISVYNILCDQIIVNKSYEILVILSEKISLYSSPNIHV